MLVRRRATPSIKFDGSHFYTWLEGGTLCEKFLAQEHNTMSPARARTQTTRSKGKRANYEATATPNWKKRLPNMIKMFVSEWSKVGMGRTINNNS